MNSAGKNIRFVTAAALFDGHDASINVVRRILQAQGAEVIHLGHNRSVSEIVKAVVEEDAQAVAISSYQGGHLEYFGYLAAQLAERGLGHVRIFGGGGGVIVPAEIAVLRGLGVSIFSPEDGQRLGLEGMVAELIAQSDYDVWELGAPTLEAVLRGDRAAVARAVTGAELGRLSAELKAGIEAAAANTRARVLGITGTGGSGKSSLTDELVRRFRCDHPNDLRVAVVAVDPSRRRGGGALLGDRIRMNSVEGEHVFFRSLATRGSHELPARTADILAVFKASGFDVVIIETPGTGQGDSGLLPFADRALYVMTPEYGAESQLEKIDMLDFADVVAVNKVERRGGADAVRHVSRQMLRNRRAFDKTPEEMPVFGTSASTFNDAGVNALYQQLRVLLGVPPGLVPESVLPRVSTAVKLLGARSERYLADIAGTVRGYHACTDRLAEGARRAQRLASVSAAFPNHRDLAEAATADAANMPAEVREALALWAKTKEEYGALRRVTQSGTPLPRVAMPRMYDHGELVQYLRRENVPGQFPFTAGVFQFKRQDEDPARMFAGEGDAFRTNRRFALLCEGQRATRLSTAFDSVTLYGRDPNERPDIYGKIGNSGVSIATLDDMKELYRGFDLLAPSTSVSMTINGPAATVLALYFNAVIDQQREAFCAQHGREPSHDELSALRRSALSSVRGTVQADILKEDQGQNTCLFSTEFSMRLMGDIQEFFVQERVRQFYSVSVSGYHIAEAGANPITQLAFTLANGFTYVEYYLARGMNIDDFAPNLSFFFSSGMDAEYSVLGRVARRVWAITMRERYGASERSQKLKYHVQTSGRSLHAQEMAFNDVRTTLQALTAIYDNTNSLHTNAYDEAVTTPTEESVRRALAIQLIIQREWGVSYTDNPLQGSFLIEELTDLVEEAVLRELEAISERGGVLGAMESGYQRGRIQDESMRYEQGKHDGTLPIVGVNVFRSATAAPEVVPALARSTDTEKSSQIERLRSFHARHCDAAPAALARLRSAAVEGKNLFCVLMDAVRVCSLQQISEAFFEVGGQYRRSV